MKIFGVSIIKNGCGHSSDRTLKLTDLKNEQMKYTDFWHVDTDSQKLKVDQRFVGWAWSKMGMTTSLVTGL